MQTDLIKYTLACSSRASKARTCTYNGIRNYQEEVEQA